MTGKYNRANCMGYALRINEWLAPYSRDFGDRMEAFSTEDMVAVLIDEYKLTPVTKGQMVLGKEYVAFRRGFEDFHFVRRLPTGQWKHKQGRTKITDIKKTEVFNDYWSYDGPREYKSKLYIFEANPDIIYQSATASTIVDWKRRRVYVDKAQNNNGVLSLNKINR